MFLPVFPLPVFLLPNGVTRLRIFEPRYLKMVSIACQEQGFVLCVYDANSEHNVPAWGTWVDIIDFYQEGEILHIDIKAKNLVNLYNVTFDDDNLRFANCELIEHWPKQNNQQHHTQLAEKLKSIYQEYPEQAALYKQPEFTNPNWVCSRFLEMLPLSFENKQLFAKEDSFQHADEFLQTMILGK